MPSQSLAAEEAGSMAGDAPVRYLDRPGGRIAYSVSGDGPLVVCAPGMGDLRSVYRRLAPDLVRAGYRVATTDLRGHGDSDTTFEAYGAVETGADLLALVRELGGPAVIVGNSMSAGSAAWAAAEDPAAVSGLVLIGPFVRDVPIGWAARFALWAALRRPWGRWAWGTYYPKLYPAAPPPDLQEHRAAIRAALSRPGAWDAFQRTTRSNPARVEARLDEVRAPALVVMGEADPDFPDPAAEAHLVADRVGGEVLLVPGAGHYPQAEFPEVVGPRVIEFLARVSPRG